MIRGHSLSPAVRNSVMSMIESWEKYEVSDVEGHALPSASGMSIAVPDEIAVSDEICWQMSGAKPARYECPVLIENPRLGDVLEIQIRTAGKIPFGVRKTNRNKMG